MRKQLAEVLQAPPDKSDKVAPEAGKPSTPSAGEAKPSLPPPKATTPKPPPPPPERKEPARPQEKPIRRADPAPDAPHDTRTTTVGACRKCGSADLKKVGAESSTRVVYVRAHVRVVEEVRETCRCRACGSFTTPPSPPTAVPGGVMAPSVLAHIGYSKGYLHLPLSRIAADLALLGVVFSSSTMSDAMSYISDLVEPLNEAIKDELFERALMWFDGSGIKVLQPGEKGKHLGQITVYSDAEAAVYDYTPTKHGSHAAAFLRVGRPNAFKGRLHADAASNANLLYVDGTIVECGCWYHARDMFVEALPSAPDDAAAGIAWIAALFSVEHEADEAGDTPDQRLERRRRDSEPVLDEMVKWMAEAVTRYSREEELPKATRYVVNHWVALKQFLTDGRVHPHEQPGRARSGSGRSRPKSLATRR